MSTRKTDLGPLTRVLRQVRRRLQGQHALDRLALSVPVSLGLLALAVVAARLGHAWLDWALPLAAALPLIAAAGALLTRVPLRSAARALDHSHRLADRVQSALQFAAERAPTDFMQATIRDATGRADHLSAQRAMPFHVPRAIRYSVPAAAALVLARWVPLPVTEPPQPPEGGAVEQAARAPLLDAETRAGFQDELQRFREQTGPSGDLEPFVRAYERILRRMERGEIDRDEALEELAELQRSLEAARAGHESALAAALQRLTTSLASARASRDLANALSRGALDRAADELEALAREAQGQGLTPRERLELRKALEEAAKDHSQDEPEEPSLLERDPPEREQASQEPNLLKKKQQKRELERLRRERRARERTRRKLERLRRELGRAGQDLQGRGGQHLRNGAERMRDLARDGMTAEQQRKLAEQLQQLREQLQRQRGGGGASPERQPGQGQGQSQRLKRFSLRAQGQNPDEDGTPLLIRRPGAKGEKPVDAPSEANKGDEEQDENEKKKKQGKGARVLDLNGEGEPNAQLEMPGMLPEQQTQVEQGNEPGDRSSENPAERLSGKLKDSQLSGTPGRGPTRSQVIYDAAQQGFATTPYTRVYTDYQSHAESVLERDEIPPGYRFYVRRYFQLIRPREGNATE